MLRSQLSRLWRPMLCGWLLGWSWHAMAAEQLYPPLTDAVLPELATAGSYAVGVKTVQLGDPNIPSTQGPGGRSLTIELWYPAQQSKESTFTTYQDQTRSGIPFVLQGNAIRAAAIASSAEPYPLVVISHGYTGYRTLMFYLAEHLASHGYIVAAIDHTDSTNAEIDPSTAPFQGFVSTLLHRARDQQWVLTSLRQTPNLTGGQLDSSRAAVIGYSMGGFGALNTIGACYDFTAATTAAFTGLSEPKAIAAMQQQLNSCAAGQYSTRTEQAIAADPAWKAAIALAPWGGQHQLFSASSLAQLAVPVLFVAGDQDDISGYAGMTDLFEKTGSPAKYLLTYHHARHNIAAHPAPAVASGSELDLGHYHEPAWSIRTINEINKHFALAMLDCHVKQRSEQCEYLNLNPALDAASTSAQTRPAEPTTSTSMSTAQQWRGFDARYATGMSWQQRIAPKQN